MNKMEKTNIILEIKNLSVEYRKSNKIIPALRDISLTLDKKETLGIVGESGCGKSTLAHAVLKLLPETEGKITSGEILFREKDSSRIDILKLADDDLRKIRGNRISMIFQDPFNSLNPVFRVGEQITEAIRIHNNAGNKSKGNDIELRNRVIKLLELVQLPNPELIMDYYPHQLSGGMQQRIMIAMALSCNPDILIADEPTTALDVTIQKDILDLLKELQKKLGLSIILISHDLGIIAQFCSRVIIFYAGTVMEKAPTDELFHNPGNPYTKGLLDSLPGKSGTAAGEHKRLKVIPGQVPDLTDLPDGCKFNPRCSFKIDKCSGKEPGFIALNKNHVSRCYLANELK